MISHRVNPPLSNDQARQHLLDNPSMHGTIMSVQGATNGKGKWSEVSYTVAYWAGDAVKSVSGIRSDWELPDEADVVAAKVGASVDVIKRGSRIDFKITAYPDAVLCQP